jgi:hypothetical protein
MLTHHNRGNGYLSVTIEGRQYSLHRLMLETFVRPPKAREVGRHLNDDRSDNRLENLAWGTYKDNADDRARNGKYAKKTHCIRNHPFNVENTWLTKEGYQQCKKCHRDRQRFHARRLRGCSR